MIYLITSGWHSAKKFVVQFSLLPTDVKYIRTEKDLSSLLPNSVVICYEEFQEKLLLWQELVRQSKLPVVYYQELKMKQVTETPEWFKLMPLNGKLNSKEVAELFGFKNFRCVTDLVAHKCFPQADGFIKKSSKMNTTKHCLWSKKTILQEIQRRKELANA